MYNAEDVDFVQRFYSETGLVDFLHYSREIFKEYFDIAGIEIPEWFPMTRHDDLAESNKELWRLLYLHDKELFKQNGDDYVFNLNELNKNQTGKYGQTMKSVTYKDALDPKVSKSVGVGDIVVLTKK